MTQRKYDFKGELWKHDGGWCFITLPKQISGKIRKAHGASEEGWGRLMCTAQIGRTSWQTAIWYDTKHGSYLLPVKALIRKKEELAIGPAHKVKLWIDLLCR